MSDKVYTTRTAAPLAQAVVLWLRLYVIASAILAICGGVHADALSKLDASAAYAVSDGLPGRETLDIAIGFAGLFYLVAYAVCIVLVAKWIYRTNRNAHAAATGMTITPPWSVGWFFVPLANLWKPFQAMRETWQVSTDPAAWRAVPTPSLLHYWWALWIASNVFGNLSFRMTMGIKTVGDAVVSDYVDVASAAVDIPLGLVLIAVVTRLTALQSRTVDADVFV